MRFLFTVIFLLVSSITIAAPVPPSCAVKVTCDGRTPDTFERVKRDNTEQCVMEETDKTSCKKFCTEKGLSLKSCEIQAIPIDNNPKQVPGGHPI